MPINHIIVHQIDKKPDGTPAVLHPRDTELPVSQATENLLADLNHGYNAKAGKGWGLCHPSSGTSSSDPRKESQKRKGPHVSGPFFEGVASVRLPKDHAAKAQVQRQLVGHCRAELVGEPVHHVLLAAEVNDPLYAYYLAGHVIGVTQSVD